MFLSCGFSFAAAQNFSKDRFNKPAEPKPAQVQEPAQEPARQQPEPVITKKPAADSDQYVLPFIKKEKNDQLKQTAKIYRQQGLEYQDMGNLEVALTFYEKAIELDPRYAEAYNDLGIIYEAKSDPVRAEACYLQAIKLDPQFLSPYSNLAILCESRRDLKNALVYWKKRARLGDSADEWTQKARQRAKDIELVLYGPAQPDNQEKIAQEKDIASLAADVKAKKAIVKQQEKDNPPAAVAAPAAVISGKRERPAELNKPPCETKRVQAKKLLQTAKASQKKGNNELAIKQGIEAEFLDPDNPEIQEFLEKALTKALAK